MSGLYLDLHDNLMREDFARYSDLSILLRQSHTTMLDTNAIRQVNCTEYCDFTTASAGVDRDGWVIVRRDMQINRLAPEHPA